MLCKFKADLTGREYIPCRASQLNTETKFVLNYFEVEEPRYLESLYPRLSDVQYRDVSGINAHMSLRRTWEYMSENNIQTAPVLDDEKHLLGLLTFSDISRFYMADQDANALAESKTSYRNLVDVLNGELIVGDLDAHFDKGRVRVAAANPDVLEDYIQEHDLVILSNRYESQLCAIEMKAGCLIIGLGSRVSRTIKKLAEEAGCSIIATPLDTYSCSKVINQAVPVRHVMKRNGLITFQPDELVEDVKKVVSKKRIRYFPILDEEKRYIGMVSQRNLLDIDKQEVVLVDHNERDQAIEGIQAARVTEIIDHHRIDALETSSPIYFRNQPLGCTATIIAQMYQENSVELTRQIAGLLCSAILSDTLMFRSPTCTSTDKRIAEGLADTAGVDIREYATAMFQAGSHLAGRSMDELLHMDYKYFQARDKKFAIAQITSVTRKELNDLKPEMLKYMKSFMPTSGLDMLFVMLTNIIDEETELLFLGANAKELSYAAFKRECDEYSVVLPGVVSRKKQLVYPLLTAIDEDSEI